MRFLLIHGGFHGAWCWDRVVPELEQLGHKAVAIDLPGHGERLGVEPLVIDSSHSPFFSKPKELEELFVHATSTTPIAPLRSN